MKKLQLILGFCIVVLSQQSSAAVIGYCLNDAKDPTTTNNTGLDVSDVTITSAINTKTNSQLIPPGGSINSTNCAGIFAGNDNPAPSANIGGAYDGLLNGADQTGGQATDPLDPNTLFVPGAFITSADLQNLDGIDQDSDGNLVDDPGWIYLGKDEGNGFGYTSPAGVNIADFLTIDFDCDSSSIGQDCKVGDWVLDFTDPEGLLAALELTVFGDSFFDHLALSFKSGNEFAVYDFDFNVLNFLYGSPFDLSVPHDLSGRFDLSALDGGISHISVWARDPANSTTSVPEPTSVLLFGLALLLVSHRVRQNSRQQLVRLTLK